MGMFNVVKNKNKCLNCDAKVEWQSKYLTYDTFVLENLLQEIPLSEHIDGEMHTFCDKCQKYIEITIKKGKETAMKPR